MREKYFSCWAERGDFRQGMSLLAVLNLLYDNIVQDWFHANAHLAATQLLLDEKPMHKAALKAEFQAAQPRKKAS